MPVDQQRRKFLLASGAALTTGIAGCNGYLEDEGSLAGDRTTAIPQEIDLPVEGEAEWVEYGETVTGELTESSPRNQEYGSYEPWAFTAREGHHVTISMESEAGDTYLYLLNEEGELLAENDDDGTSLNSRIFGYELSETGSYVVLAGSYDDGVGFEYELSLREGAEGETRDLREIAVGETAQGMVDAADPYDEEWQGTHEPVAVQSDSTQTIDISASSESSFYLLLADSEDTLVGSDSSHGGSGTAEINYAQIDGDNEYFIHIIPITREQLEYELTVEEAEERSGGGRDLRSIDFGETVSGEIDRNDPESSEYNGYFEPVSFRGEAGQIVDIEMTSERGDTYLYLVDSDQNVITADDDGGSGLNSAIRDLELPSDGRYYIIATSYSPNATFEYQLSLDEGGSSGGGRDLRSIEFGETARGEIDHNDPESSRYNGYFEPVSFRGEAGQIVDIEMTSEQGDTYLYLVDSDQNVITADDDGGSGLNSAIRSQELPSDGRYYIIATSYSSNATFEYQLSLDEGGSSGGGRDLRSIDFGETARGEIDRNDPQNDRFRGYFEPVSFRGEAGQIVDIQMTSERGDTYLFLFDPDQNVIAENDDGGSGLNSAIRSQELPSDGRYYIIATSFSSNDTFEYQLSLEESGSSGSSRDLRTIDFGETARGEIDRNDPQSDRFRGYFEPVSFRGEAGQTVDIEMTSERGDTYLFLLDPDQNVIRRNDDGGSGLNSAIRNQELPSSGRYYIIATSYSSRATFEYELTLTES